MLAHGFCAGSLHGGGTIPAATCCGFWPVVSRRSRQVRMELPACRAAQQMSTLRRLMVNLKIESV